MVNRFLQKLIRVPLLGIALCVPMHANIFLDTAQAQVDKVTDKKPVHKSPLEFRQAVARYIKNSDTHYFHNAQRNSDENVSYKKELRYLFKNYEKISILALLSRLRSAHQAMVKQDTEVDGEGYQKYEHICSALLLTCTQVFVNDVRNQILNALHEIDNLIVYWRYQQHHQISYFFSKSPIKWVVGKSQEKEIIHNIIRLERKQSELYTMLGSLTGHLHVFTEIGTEYDNCYDWIEQLFAIVACIDTKSSYKSDGTLFDILAAQLELKLKRVSKFKDDCMSSLKMVKKPSHFTRHWIAYTTALAATGYALHYNSKNPEIVRSAIGAMQSEASKFLVLLLHPLKKVYERGKLIFSDEQKKVSHSEKQTGDASGQNITEQKKSADELKSLDELLNEIITVGKDIESGIAQELRRSNTAVRQDGFDHLDKAIEKMKNPNDGYIYNSAYTFDEDGIRKAIEAIRTIVVPIEKAVIVINEDGKEELKYIVLNKKEVNDYKQAQKYIDEFINKISEQTSFKWDSGRDIWWKLNFGGGLLRADDDYLSPLQRYTDIIDKRIIRLFELAAVIVEKFGRRGDKLIAEADQQLRDHELTLMFTSLIPLALTSLGITKAYQWITTRDYSPIRIALADVNSLLIESVMHLDDHDYGKLVYLICKLRHRSTYLKDALSNEFLADVAKLESKRYSAQTKRGIVENMFNKYAFLGRIAV